MIPPKVLNAEIEHHRIVELWGSDGKEIIGEAYRFHACGGIGDNSVRNTPRLGNILWGKGGANYVFAGVGLLARKLFNFRRDDGGAAMNVGECFSTTNSIGGVKDIEHSISFESNQDNSQVLNPNPNVIELVRVVPQQNQNQPVIKERDNEVDQLDITSSEIASIVGDTSMIGHSSFSDDNNEVSQSLDHSLVHEDFANDNTSRYPLVNATTPTNQQQITKASSATAYNVWAKAFESSHWATSKKSQEEELRLHLQRQGGGMVTPTSSSLREDKDEKVGNGSFSYDYNDDDDADSRDGITSGIGGNERLIV